MRIGMPRFFAAGAGAAMLALATPATAQNLPQGSYLQTCSNVRVVDNVLSATCLMANQAPRETSLANPYNCQGAIDNRDGRLVCSAATSMPARSQSIMRMAKFSASCLGSSQFIVRAGGYPNDVLRFTLGLGQVVHFELPEGSTYAMACDSWPNGGYNSVNF